ncbi:hypothetical protein KRR40_39085 [Niabella defluvii]|nr:hypothetical protein KRR40_39085 [Niabella sp. I65]
MGKKLTIITQTLHSNNAIKIVIDWEEFETDKELIAITNIIESTPKQKKGRDRPYY